MSGTASDTNLHADVLIFRETNSILILSGVSPAHIGVATDQSFLEHMLLININFDSDNLAFSGVN